MTFCIIIIWINCIDKIRKGIFATINCLGFAEIDCILKISISNNNVFGVGFCQLLLNKIFISIISLYIQILSIAEG